MPIQRCTLPGGGSGWKWGTSGKCYASRKDAERQATAAYASGYREKVALEPDLVITVPSAQLYKDSPTAGGVHTPGSIGNDDEAKKPKKKPSLTVVGKPKPDTEPAAVDVNKFSVFKVDEKLGLVFGWAIISKIKGEDYVDLQGDVIPEEAMLEAAVDFIENSAVAKEMHNGKAIGSIPFCFPLTSDIAKSMGIATETTGLMIAMKPNRAVFSKFTDGTYTGFSIGGAVVEVH